MGMRTSHHGGPSVAVMTHCRLLGRGFGVKIYQHRMDRYPDRMSRQQRADGSEGVIIRRLHEDPANCRNDQEFPVAVVGKDSMTISWCMAGQVERPEKPGLAVNLRHQRPLVERVVAECNAIDTGCQDGFGMGEGDAISLRGVFAIGHDKIRVQQFTNPRNPGGYCIASASADDVTKKQYAHLGPDCLTPGLVAQLGNTAFGYNHVEWLVKRFCRDPLQFLAGECQADGGRRPGLPEAGERPVIISPAIAKTKPPLVKCQQGDHEDFRSDPVSRSWNRNPVFSLDQ